MENLLSISKVCELLHTTSRTLRFYEEKSLIKSTRIADSPIRYYTIEEVERIRKILILRSLHLPLHEIQSLIDHNNFVDSLSQQMRILASKQQSIYQNYLTLHKIPADSIHTVSDLKNAITQNALMEQNTPEYRTKKTLALHATNLLLEDKLQEFYSIFDEDFKQLIGINTLEAVWGAYPHNPDFMRTIVTSYQNKHDFIVIVQTETCKILITYSYTDPNQLSGVAFEEME